MRPGSNGLWTEQEVAECIEDTFRIMSYLGIREEMFGTIRQMEINEAVYEEAEADGLQKLMPVTSMKQVLQTKTVMS